MSQYLNYFYDICKIPHGSHNEKALSEYLINFAKQHNLRYKTDDVYNVIIYKNGTSKSDKVLALQAHIDMVDVNLRAIHLAKMNAKENDVKNVSIFSSNIYENIVKKYDFIITNPPIRAGKEVVYKFLFEAKEHLKKDGILYYVINKEQGAKSSIRDLEKIAKVNVIEKNKGFFVIKCKFD